MRQLGGGKIAVVSPRPACDAQVLSSGSLPGLMKEVPALESGKPSDPGTKSLSKGHMPSSGHVAYLLSVFPQILGSARPGFHDPKGPHTSEMGENSQVNSINDFRP